MGADHFHLNRFEDSLFYKTLTQHASKDGAHPDIQTMRSDVLRVVRAAAAISKWVCVWLPQFTLHDEVHLLNVLSFMERLATAPVIERLGPAECAMAILAAYTHDLGMVMDARELAVLDAIDQGDSDASGPADGRPVISDAAEQAWRTFRDGHADWPSIREAPRSSVSRQRLGLIRADYIRISHAKDDDIGEWSRLGNWLRNVQDADIHLALSYCGFDFTQRLTLLGLSHNYGPDWLTSRIGADAHVHDCGAELGKVHWSWLGWLLRLADVFDCDASRTPRVLFAHGGITDKVSQTEWKKHLALPQRPQFNHGSDGKALRYLCGNCPSPRVEKALHQIIGWMNEEITKVRAGWHQLPEKVREELELDLPSRAVVAIEAREGGYLYHDMEFRLDREAVTELLMGESLYGEPAMALRELVQNALDAVNLRNQRNELQAKLDGTGANERARQPYQDWGKSEEPCVRVTWGSKERDGRLRQYIEVEDNGAGMTIAAMKSFLTRVGRSYYKSTEFLAEQALMRRHGILCTAISQFGIGFLSVFMLADHVTIVTRSCGAADRPPGGTSRADLESARFPIRAEIDGPHGMLWFYPDNSRPRPGTRITLWLKTGKDGEPIFHFPSPSADASEWDRERVIRKLQDEFYGMVPKENVECDKSDDVRDMKDGRMLLDPAFEIGRFIVWPLYPVILSREHAKRDIRLDAGFHLRELVPLDTAALAAKARAWGLDLTPLGSIGWQACEWQDVQIDEKGHAGGTGSRIRLVSAQPSGMPENPRTVADWVILPDSLADGFDRWMLADFSEAQLPNGRCRYQCLVNGVRIVPGLIPSDDERDCRLASVVERLPMWPSQGGWVWLDLRGEAMPRLRADRAAPTVRQSFETDEAQKGVMARWLAAWSAAITGTGAASSSPALPAWLEHVVACRVLRVNRAPNGGASVPSAQMLSASVLQQWAIAASAFPGLAVSLRCNVIRDFDLVYILEQMYLNKGLRTLEFTNLDEAARKVARACGDAIGHRVTRLTIPFDETEISERAFRRARSEQGQFSRSPHPVRFLIRSHFASESFWPSLAEAHAGCPLRNQSGRLADFTLAGPGRMMRANDVVANRPSWVEVYDLCGPWTAFALGHLRTARNNWMLARNLRLVCMVPFFHVKLAQQLAAKADEIITLLGVESLMLLLPAPELERKLFHELPKEEWHARCASALWDIRRGQVLYADGVHTRESLRSDGLPLVEWLEKTRLPGNGAE